MTRNRNPRILGTVDHVARAWGLEGRLAGAATIGYAYGECVRCTVETTRRAKVLAGAAHTEERRIVLNAELLRRGREASRNATLLHECAHVLADLRYRADCRHDRRWKRVMAMLGEPPEISHRLDFLSHEFHAVVSWICVGCGEEFHYVRPPRRPIEVCYCPRCGPEAGRLRNAEIPRRRKGSRAVQLRLF